VLKVVSVVGIGVFSCKEWVGKPFSQIVNSLYRWLLHASRLSVRRGLISCCYHESMSHVAVLYVYEEFQLLTPCFQSTAENEWWTWQLVTRSATVNACRVKDAYRGTTTILTSVCLSVTSSLIIDTPQLQR